MIGLLRVLGARSLTISLKQLVWALARAIVPEQDAFRGCLSGQTLKEDSSKNAHIHKLKSLILAQIERWRYA